MYDSVVFRKVPECDPGLVSQAANYGVADLHEALGPITGRISLMSSRMRPIAVGQKIVGCAVTAFNYPGDNLMIHKALQLARAGQVLVLTNGGGQHGSLWGDVAATYAKEKKIAGVIADGPVRDVDANREMKFPVWSTTISPSHPEKRGPGAVNIPVVCDGVLVNPGDVIVADGDGVLVIPREDLARAIEAAEARSANEVELRRQIKSGASLFDLLNMQDKINAAGIKELDSTWLEMNTSK